MLPPLERHQWEELDFIWQLQSSVCVCACWCGKTTTTKTCSKQRWGSDNRSERLVVTLERLVSAAELATLATATLSSTTVPSLCLSAGCSCRADRWHSTRRWRHSVKPWRNYMMNNKNNNNKKTRLNKSFSQGDNYKDGTRRKQTQREVTSGGSHRRLHHLWPSLFTNKDSIEVCIGVKDTAETSVSPVNKSWC